MSPTLAIASGLLISPVPAQVIPDRSLSNNSSVAVEGNVSTITGGTLAGKNLFHSFSQFSVPTNGTAYFNNTSDIQNILSRVTGSSISNIDGLIRANGTASLFLINPNGIIFGKNAKLQIGGSLLATTADAIQFDDQNSFSASDPNAAPLLTVNPSALLFNRIERAGIQNNSHTSSSADEAFGLKVREGRSLLLVGGNIDMRGSRLTAPGGRVELVGVADKGRVDLKLSGEELRLEVPKGLTRAPVALTDGARISVAKDNGGSIAIVAQSLEIANKSDLEAGIAPKLGTEESKAGDVTLDAIDAITVTGESQIKNIVAPNSTGQGGKISIHTGSLSMLEGSQLNASTFGTGNAGAIVIRARGQVTLKGNLDGGSGDRFSGAQSRVGDSKLGPNVHGRGGNIEIEAKSLLIEDRARLSTSTYGYGNAGNVTIRAADSVTVRGPGPTQAEGRAISSNVHDPARQLKIEPETYRSGGIVTIETGSLSITNNALISVDTNGKGNAGSVQINAKDVVLSSSNIVSRLGEIEMPDAKGNGGKIDIETDSLRIDNKIEQGNAGLSVSTYGQGNAGSITINARDITLTNSGSRISSNVHPGANGNGGKIKISTESFSIRDRANVFIKTEGRGNAGSLKIETGSLRIDNKIGQDNAGLSVSTYGQGNAGNITINARDIILTNPGSRISSNVHPGASGNGGEIKISTESLSIRDRANVFIKTEGHGNAGSLEILAHYGNVSIENGSRLSASTLIQGKEDTSNITAGNISLQARRLLLDNQAEILGETTSSQNGGNITLTLGNLLLLRRSSNISTSAGTEEGTGNGGNITIRSPLIVTVPTERSNITTEAYTGTGGKINITTQGLIGFQQQSRNPQLSRISASSDFGIDGQVNINVLSVNPSQGLVNLPTVSVDASRLITQQCSPSRASGEISQFVITGRGGLPTAPGEPLRSSSVLTPWVNLPSDVAISTEQNAARSGVNTKPDAVRQSSNRAASPPEKLVEAQGWVKDAQGNVALIAQVPSDSSVQLSSVPCHGF
ncbi:filamentous hemagglutinin N-terminal domain-containing protein [Cyanobacteria bacterium FACHB-DQ100]|nr:filamentous hemagglutinin N-terminal domain-containing protein [Cyanobacteria bacterium FACHB-DQ100]